MRRTVAMLAAIGLAGAGLAQAPRGPSAQDYARRLSALPEIQRYAALRNAIMGNRQWCKRVMSAARQGPYRNLDMWVARCGPTPTVDYGLFLGPDGTVQVSACRDLVKVKWPACRRLP